MFNCEIEFKKDGIITHLHPATKKLIIDDICARLKALQPEMDEFPSGKITATYENQELVLTILNYSPELAYKIEEAIRKPPAPELQFDLPMMN